MWKAIWSQAKDYATAILFILTFIQLPFTIFRNTGSLEVAIFGAAIAIVAVLVGIFTHLLRPVLARKFGAPLNKSDPILVSKTESVTIEQDYTTNIKTEKLLVFTKKPEAGDLVDTFDVVPGLDFTSASYQSTDGAPRDIVRIRPNRLAVYWWPKEEIIVNSIYKHTTSRNIPDKYGPDGFFQANYVDLRTGIISWRFLCPHPIEFAAATVLPFYVKNITHPRLYRLFAEEREFHGEQPTISSDRLSIEWKLTNPVRWKSYIMMAFYEGGREKYIEDCQNEYTSIKLRVWLQSVTRPKVIRPKSSVRDA